MTARVDLDSRYGRSTGRMRRIRNIVIVAVVLLLAGGAAWIAWIGLFTPAREVEGQAIGYTLIERGVRVRAEVSAPPGRAVACAVEADSKDGAIVGWKTVRLDPSGQRTRRITVDVRTTAPVYTGLINRCWLT